MISFFSKKQRKIEGSFGYHGLADWWMESFTEEERNHILETFNPIGSTSEKLIKGNIALTTESPVSLLSSLSGWFKKDYTIAAKMLEKAESLIDDTTKLEHVHFLYQHKVEHAYPKRDKEPGALERAIEACEQQIAISKQVKDSMLEEYGPPLPAHRGYEQLAIIEHKRENYERVIELSKQAMEQGWRSDWEKRIEKAQKKLNQDYNN